jgi:hypothetical protein
MTMTWEVTPVDARSSVDIRADDVPDGINAQITRRDCGPRWTISPLPLNAERRLPRSTVLVATATIRVVATEGQIYGRQPQQAGDYTGPHRDPLTGLRARSPTDAGVPSGFGQALAPDEEEALCGAGIAASYRTNATARGS